MSGIGPVHSSMYNKTFSEPISFDKKQAVSQENFSANLEHSLNDQERNYYTTGVLSLEEITMLNSTYSQSVTDIRV